VSRDREKHRQRAREQTARRHKLTRFLRDWLIKTLGGRCEKCGETNSTLLTVEHKQGRDYEARKLSWHQRIARYWQEHRSGVPLGVLCLPCNSGGGLHWSQQYQQKSDPSEQGNGPMNDLEEAPF
jgi:hypothetical protein